MDQVISKVWKNIQKNRRRQQKRVNSDKKEQRLRFIRDFIRPHGLDKSASEIMAKAIEYVALHKDIQRYSYN